eukprot:1636113-Pyramimonas_sp.AAC.1
MCFTQFVVQGLVASSDSTAAAGPALELANTILWPLPGASSSVPPGDLGTSSSSSWTRGPSGSAEVGLEGFKDLQHRPVCHGRTIICQACTCFVILPA